MQWTGRGWIKKVTEYFVKKLWCFLGGEVKHDNLDLSTELIRQISHSKGSSTQPPRLFLAEHGIIDN